MSVHNRKCDLCTKHVPESQGVYVAFFGILICRACDDRFMPLEKDYSKSLKGRRRNKQEFLRAVRAAQGNES